MLAEGLARHGAEPVTAAAGEQALALLANQRPDVLVSDLGLSDMHGCQLMQRVRSLPGLQHLPGIALTGEGTAPERDAAFAAGFSKHLLKPAKMSDLVAAILAVELRTRNPGESPRDIRQLLAQLSRSSPCRFTSLLRFTDDDTLSSVWTHDRENPDVDPFPLGLPVQASYCVLVRQTGETCAIEDARTDPKAALHSKRDELVSYIGVPVRGADGRMFGTLCSYDAQPMTLPRSVRDAIEKATRELEGTLSSILGLGRLET
ncbi:MAG: response regulator [Deltaproteobacteria bacterium]|nr:response regulator [Deltaproteobacteria bacterium]MDQ3295356.1 response regulator [Myxococcota bacterium]